jgi:hypothetical protein
VRQCRRQGMTGVLVSHRRIFRSTFALRHWRSGKTEAILGRRRHLRIHIEMVLVLALEWVLKKV